MDNKQAPAHDEETLIEKVFSGKTDDLLPLLSEHPEYAGFVKDMQELKNGLSSIDDEEPPPMRLEKIRKNKKSPLQPPEIQFLPSEWYRNPFLLSFGFLIFVLVIYVLLTFVFK
jgi:hypothetical protein